MEVEGGRGDRGGGARGEGRGRGKGKGGKWRGSMG